MGILDQPCADRSAADGHHLQRRGGALPGGLQPQGPGPEHLRQQDQTVGRVLDDRLVEHRRVEAGRTAQPDTFEWQHHTLRAVCQGGHDTRDVLQQDGQRQRAQVLLDVQWRQRLHEALDHLVHALGTEANPFGVAGGARGEGDLAGARRHRDLPSGQAQLRQHLGTGGQRAMGESGPP